MVALVNTLAPIIQNYGRDVNVLSLGKLEGDSHDRKRQLPKPYIIRMKTKTYLNQDTSPPRKTLECTMLFHNEYVPKLNDTLTLDNIKFVINSIENKIFQGNTISYKMEGYA